MQLYQHNAYMQYIYVDMRGNSSCMSAKKNIFNVIMKKLHNNMNKLHIIIKSVAHQQHKIIEL